MATKTQATYMRVYDALEPQVIGSDTTTTGAIFDTADYDMGITFAMLCKSYTDGTFTLKIEHGDDSGLSDAADVDAAMLVYGSLPALTAAMTEGDAMPREGIHSTKRYVRASIVSTSVTTGATLQVIIIKGPELLPAPQDT